MSRRPGGKRQRVLEAVRAGANTANRICSATGFRVATVRALLQDLAKDGRLVVIPGDVRTIPAGAAQNRFEIAPRREK